MVYLTDRCYKIINLLLEQEKITTKQIARAIGVSERTVRYDLDTIDYWLKEKGVNLKRKNKIGIWIENRSQNLIKLKEFLDPAADNYHVFNSEERKKIILQMLFESQRPLSIMELAENIKVSRTTIIKDLDDVEKWLQKRNIRLLRKPNYGIFLECDEISWRKGIIELISENIDKTNLVKFLKQNRLTGLKSSRIDFLLNKHLTELFSKVDIIFIENCVEMIEQRLNIKFVDAALIGLVIHIALAIKRLQQQKQITMPEEQLTALKNTDEFNVARVVAEKLGEQFKVSIPEAEIGYITLHIMGAKIRENYTAESYSGLNATDKEKDIIQKFIKITSSLLNVDLSKDDELLKNLCIHLKPAINRLKYGMSIFNPLLKDIKTKYGIVFSAAKRASEIFENELGVSLNDDEIGYIAMHIGASLERNNYNIFDTRIKIVAVCSSGIGTAKLLSSRIKKEFPEIEIIREVSLAELNEEVLNDASFVVTTIPIEDIFYKPVIYVSPLLEEKDIELIRAVIRKTGPNFSKHDQIIEKIISAVERNCKIINRLNLIKELENIFNIQQEWKGDRLPMLLDLITEKTIAVDVEAGDWKEAIRKAGELLVEQNYVKPDYVEAMIKTAEGMKAYIVITPGVALPHARPEYGVNKVCMSLALLKTPVNFGHPKNDPVKAVIALGAVDNHTHLKALAELSDFLDSQTNIEKLFQCKNVHQVMELFKNKDGSN